MITWTDVSAFNQQLLLLVIVLVTRIAIQRIAPHHPWAAFRFYCAALANKVNKAENSHAQQRVAGIIAVLITFVPIWLIVWLFESLVAVPELWQGLLLYLAIGCGDIFAVAKKAAKAVTANDNYRAKQLLNHYILRDTEQLSGLGINKAVIEMQILKHLQLYLVPVLLFLTFGSLVAFSYRLLHEMHYSWNIKQHRFQYFGAFTNALSQIIQWLPNRIFLLFALILSVGHNFVLIWRLTLEHFFRVNNNCVLAFFAPTHNIKLGGVAMYNGTKLRRKAFNDNGRQPEPKDIIHVQRFMSRIYALMAVTVAAISVTSQLLQ
ncbi:cobalamin biosynthesis protein CobD/CbiB [Thalassotalea atypica]|uniref:cobalamin biosynthesis protein CobD/CbiB n=1 Tax=Thalassotalea atypica TaxID=2054316 RepID=UPI002573E38C|nr:cobalamin biosynthesis protein [Thalassotalea atypica]